MHAFPRPRRDGGHAAAPGRTCAPARGEIQLSLPRPVGPAPRHAVHRHHRQPPPAQAVACGAGETVPQAHGIADGKARNAADAVAGRRGGGLWAKASLDLFESEIHHQPAELELPLYLTTNIDNFMTLALQAKVGKARREVVPWREPSMQRRDLNPPCAPDDPVVMHLFGTDADLLSMVVTEDDHLDYLARISHDHDYFLPVSVNERLASTTLLFLGYRLEDLDLKIIMRGLLTHLDLQRWNMLHVAVQLESSQRDEAKEKCRRVAIGIAAVVFMTLSGLLFWALDASCKAKQEATKLAPSKAFALMQDGDTDGALLLMMDALSAFSDKQLPDSVAIGAHKVLEQAARQTVFEIGKPSLLIKGKKGFYMLEKAKAKLYRFDGKTKPVPINNRETSGSPVQAAAYVEVKNQIVLVRDDLVSEKLLSSMI